MQWKQKMSGSKDELEAKLGIPDEGMELSKLVAGGIRRRSQSEHLESVPEGNRVSCDGRLAPLLVLEPHASGVSPSGMRNN